MKSQLETLKKIQDLTLTRAECVTRGAQDRVVAIDQEIAALVETLEPRIRALYTAFREDIESDYFFVGERLV